MTLRILYVFVLFMTFTRVCFSDPYYKGDDDPFPTFEIPTITFDYVQPPPIPAPPVFTFPKIEFPAPPPFVMPQFPSIPPINFPKMPTVEDIVNQAGKPGSNVIGVYSSQLTKPGKDGKPVQQDGSTIIVSDGNGKVTVTKNKYIQIWLQNTSKDEFSDLLARQFNHFKSRHPMHPKFEPFMKPSPPMDDESIKGYVPGKNEKFFGKVYSSESFYKNVNGEETSGGSSREITNVNGKVDERNQVYGDAPS